MTDRDNGARSDRQQPGQAVPDSTHDSGTRLGRAAAAVALLSLASSCLGLLRDLSLAGLFGASGDTDAFLIAWTIPETITPLLMEGAMTFLLVPVFIRELTKTGSVDRIVRSTLLPLLLVLAILTAAAALTAPLIVGLLAPGIANPALAIRLFRMACLTVLFMGLSGYLMATLRAHQRFIAPASTYLAYNVAILICMYTLHRQLGVFAAAIGLAVGSAAMVAVQVPQFLQVASVTRLRLRITPRLLVATSAFVPIAAYTLGRQAQVFIERTIGSLLEPGSISYLNYASKVAQVPMLLAITAATVAFPSLARAAADPPAFRLRAQIELRRVGLLILPSTAFLLIFARPSVELLFERGAFSAADTVATAAVMQLYSLGLLGQVFVAVTVLVYFSSHRRTWLPALAAVGSLAVTLGLDLGLLHLLGVRALALGNAAGITVAAVILLIALDRRVTHYDLAGLVRMLLLAGLVSMAAAGVAAVICKILSNTNAVQVLVGAPLTVALCLLFGALVRIPEATALIRTAAAGAVEVIAKGKVFR